MYVTEYCILFWWEYSQRVIHGEQIRPVTRGTELLLQT